jgi:hypothetical protein
MVGDMSSKTLSILNHRSETYEKLKAEADAVGLTVPEYPAEIHRRGIARTLEDEKTREDRRCRVDPGMPGRTRRADGRVAEGHSCSSLMRQ